MKRRVPDTVAPHQPKLDLTSGRIVGAEALLRWQSPELGRVMLSDFIPILDVVEDDSAVKVGKTIIDLGHALDMTVIAEGGETE